LAAVVLCAFLLASLSGASAAGTDRRQFEQPILMTQLPASAGQGAESVAGGNARGDFGSGGRIVMLDPDGSLQLLTDGFASACDPSVSFDAQRVLFAGKRVGSDPWNIFELVLATGKVRQITRDLGNCRSPNYQSTLYTIVSPQPWYQLTFVSDAAGTINEDGSGPATDLYSCKLDGSAVRRLTYNLSSDIDPFLMSDGRILYAGWQRSRIEHGLLGRWSLFGINLDGADVALHAEQAGARTKQMPCVTRGLVVFVESDHPPWDGSGSLAAVTVRRPLHSYRRLTTPEDGLFHSPSPLPDGALLVSRRTAANPHAVQRWEPRTGKSQVVFQDPDYHCVQARLLARRREPDGRSSVVTEEDPRGKLYCLNVYTSDLEDPAWMPPGTARRIRVLEGIAIPTSQRAVYHSGTEATTGNLPGSGTFGLGPSVPRRILGEVDIQPDGSFHLDVPANTPIELQMLDADGLALRSCSWIWAKNHEPRGCIGCHEDGELTPENLFVEAMNDNEESVGLPSADPRSVDFLRDILPIVDSKCAPCHTEGTSPPRLDHEGNRSHWRTLHRAYINLLTSRENGSGGRYVDPGRARTSPLMWHVLGRKTARPWDAPRQDAAVKPIPAGEVPPLTPEEQRLIAEWIDLGALWSFPDFASSTSEPAQQEVDSP
jgi:hypothetical protein